MQKKALKIIILAFVILFLLLNIVWLCYYLMYYQPFRTAAATVSEQEKLSYTYSTVAPDYLHYTCNVGISTNRKMNQSGLDVSGNSVDIVVWSKLFGKNEYGVIINYIKEQTKDETAYASCEIKIDQNGELKENLSKEDLERFTSEKNNITLLLQKVREKWGL